MKKIVLCGYYGFQNLGDEAILNYLIHFLKENRIEPIVLSANPEFTSSTYQVKAVNRNDFTEVLDTLKNADGLMMGGGSLLQDVTSKKSLIYYLIMIYMAKKIAKKPVYFYGQGVGPINGKDSRFLTKFVLKNVDVLSVRDKDSYSLLKDKIGLKNPVDLIYDPVLLTPKAKSETISGFSEEELAFLEKRPVFLSIRPTTQNQNVVNAFFGYMKYLKEQNIPVVSFPFHHEQDVTITTDILNRFDNALVLERPVSIEEARFILSKSRLAVGMRLHSLIIAASQQIPFIGISYDPKIDALAEQFDSHIAGDISTVTAEQLIHETELVLGNELIVKTLLQNKLENVKAANDEFNQKLLQIIG